MAADIKMRPPHFVVNDQPYRLGFLKSKFAGLMFHRWSASSASSSSRSKSVLDPLDTSGSISCAAKSASTPGIIPSNEKTARPSGRYAPPVIATQVAIKSSPANSERPPARRNFFARTLRARATDSATGSSDSSSRTSRLSTVRLSLGSDKKPNPHCTVFGVIEMFISCPPGRWAVCMPFSHHTPGIQRPTVRRLSIMTLHPLQPKESRT